MYFSMNLILKIAFNSLTDMQVTIENPSYVPALGEIVDLKPEDYFPILPDMDIMKEYAEKGVWKVGFKTVHYQKEATTVLIVLEEGGISDF